MHALSHGASMAWQLAASEAARTQQRYIERESVFIGVCRLGTWLRAVSPSGQRSALEARTLQTIQEEADTIEELLRVASLAPQIVCRAVRTAVGKGRHSHGTEAVVHRSQACKICFQRAEALAASSHAPDVHCLHLFSALLEHPGPVLTGVLGVFHVEAKALHAQVVATTFAMDALHLRSSSKGQGVSHLIYVGAEGQT